MEDRRSKYNFGGQKERTNTQEAPKINIRFDITELDLFCAYVVSENKAIRRTGLTNLKKVIDMMDLSVFNGEEELLKRIEFIRRGLDARLGKNLTNGYMIISDIIGGLGCPVKLPKELTTSEVNWVDDNVSTILKYAYIEAQADEGLDLITRLKAAVYSTKEAAVRAFEEWIDKLKTTFRKLTVDKSEERSFSLSDESFIDAILETYDEVTSPSNKLKFGTTGLNLVFGGGVERGRVYMLFGLPGEGKSSSLLDMAIQLKRYNTQVRTKDPTKRPCVVLSVMENTWKETIQRLFAMGVLKDMTQFNREDLIETFKTRGLRVSDKDPVDLVIRVRPKLSADTSYFYTLYDELLDQGLEMIALAHDYAKCILSVEKQYNGEMRLQLGAVTNEYKVFAETKDVAVLSASQINRVGTTNVDLARASNKTEVVRALGRANIGESNLMLENIDAGFVIAPETDPDTGVLYLGIARIKSRDYVPGGYEKIFIPYVPGTIKFVEDLNAVKPVYKLSMKRDETLNMYASKDGISPNIAGSPNAVAEAKPKTRSDINREEEIINSIFGAGSIAASMPTPLNVQPMPTVTMITIVAPPMEIDQFIAKRARKKTMYHLV